MGAKLQRPRAELGLGAAAAGERGVDYVARLYRQEIEETLQLLGVSDVTALNRSHVEFPAE